MFSLAKKIKTIFSLLFSGDLNVLKSIILKRIYSTEEYYILKRNLEYNLTDHKPKARIEINIRPYQESDYKYFKHLPEKLLLFDTGIETPYVAVTENDEPCFIQWLIDSSQNDKIKKHFGNNLPALKKTECMQEGSYTLKKYRGLYIMVEASYLIGKKAKELGYKHVIACVSSNNKTALRAVERLGCKPYKIQTIKWRLFKNSTNYTSVKKDSANLCNAIATS